MINESLSWAFCRHNSVWKLSNKTFVFHRSSMYLIEKINRNASYIWFIILSADSKTHFRSQTHFTVQIRDSCAAENDLVLINVPQDLRDSEQRCHALWLFVVHFWRKLYTFASFHSKINNRTWLSVLWKHHCCAGGIKQSALKFT